jgi:catechol 2,3-dioxygenase-like lactoylglutathione lyase family enzyme
MSSLTDLFAGVPVSDLDAGIDWYTRFFGRPPDRRVGEEMSYSNGVRHVKVPDPDVNAIALAEPPDSEREPPPR